MSNNMQRIIFVQQKKVNTCAFVVVCALAALLPLFATAQSEDRLTLTLTPPLIQVTIGPGESWSSSLKVVNNNPYDVTLYASVMDFASQGDSGQGKLTPVIRREGETLNILAEWIEVSEEPFLVPKETSYEVPFTVRIPENVSPGGHYATILVGTQSLATTTNGPVISVSSLISSLLFVRIKGETIEKGYIQSFLSEHRIYSQQKPEVKFALKFKNDGSVHLQPKGDVRILTMWGNEVGNIPINQNTNFGNVLPESSRIYEFTWQGEEGVFDVGLYRAIATLTFGEDGHQKIVGETSFWIIPLKPLLFTLGGLLLLVLVTTLLIRGYIRRSLARL